MAESLSSQPADAPTDADAVARKQFDVARRGFDQNQVRAYLYSVASSLRAGERREAELRERVAAAVRRAHDAEKLDDNALTERLGEETVRVLTTAREAAEAQVARADEEAEGILDAARTEAAEIRSEADAVLEQRSAEAETAAEAIRSEARNRGKSKDLAAAEIEKGRLAAAELIAEAQAVREDVLRDMSRRRQHGKAQVERLRAGRDRLMGTFDTVQEALDEVRSGVKNSLGEAKVAADIAARRVLEEREPALDELEAEVETTRMLGLAVEATAPDDAEVEEAAPPETKPAEEPAADVAAESEPRTVELDPEVRAGKKLRDQPEVPGDDLQTVVFGDPVESVEVMDVDESPEEEAPEEEAPEEEAPEEEAPEEQDELEEPVSEVDDIFARLRTEQPEPVDDGADTETTDLFDEAPESETSELAESDDAEPAEEDDEIELLDEVSAALVSTAERRLKRVLADDQNRVLSGLRPKGKGKRKGAPPDQLDLDTQVELYVEAVSAQLEARPDGSAHDLDEARRVLAETFVGPLREAVIEAVASADDPDDKVSAVRAVYRTRKAAMGEIASELIG